MAKRACRSYLNVLKGGACVTLESIAHMEVSQIQKRVASYTKKDILYPLDLLEIQDGVDMVVDGQTGSKTRKEKHNEIMASLLNYRRGLYALKNKLEDNAGATVSGKMARIAELREDRILSMISNLQLAGRVLDAHRPSPESNEAEKVEPAKKITDDIVDLLKDTMYGRGVYYELMYKAYAEVLYASGQGNANKDVDQFLKMSENYKQRLDLMEDNLLDIIYRQDVARGK